MPHTPGPSSRGDACRSAGAAVAAGGRTGGCARLVLGGVRRDEGARGRGHPRAPQCAPQGSLVFAPAAAAARAQFGKRILKEAASAPEGWSSYYIDYKALKKLISAAVATQKGDDAAEIVTADTFVAALHYETSRVSKHCATVWRAARPPPISPVDTALRGCRVWR